MTVIAKPRITPHRRWGGELLARVHWLCMGRGGRWGFGATPLEAWQRYELSCRHFTEMGAPD